MGAGLRCEPGLFILALLTRGLLPLAAIAAPPLPGLELPRVFICDLRGTPPHQGRLPTEGLPAASPLRPDQPPQGGQPARDWGFGGSKDSRKTAVKLLVTSTCLDGLWTAGVAAGCPFLLRLALSPDLGFLLPENSAHLPS